MRRLLLFIVAAICLCSCSKESSNALKGTRWETDDFTLLNSIWGYKYHVYEFEDKSNVLSYWLDRQGKVAMSEGEFNYKIEYPYVYVEHSKDDIRKLEMVDKMTLVITTNTSIKYYKQ